MTDEPEHLCNVVRQQDGALIIRDITLDQARSEAARLNAEARIPIGAHDGDHPEPRRATSMYLGEVCIYEVRSLEGLVIS
jgi:hypothetical protein